MSAQPEVPRSRRGRPPCCPPDVVGRVVGLRLAGLSHAQISIRLNGDGILRALRKISYMMPGVS